MAIAFDNVAIHTGPGTVGTADTFSYTTNVANCMVNVIVVGGDNSGDIGYSTCTIDGNSMTKQGEAVDSAGNRVAMFSGTIAASGSHTIVVTPHTQTSVNNENITSYSGVNDVVNGSTAHNSGASITFTPTVSTANSWVIMGGTSRTGPHNPTPSTNVVNDRTNGSTVIGAGDSGAISSNTAFTWNNASSNENTFVFTVMEPSAGAAATHYLTLMNVGT